MVFSQLVITPFQSVCEWKEEFRELFKRGKRGMIWNGLCDAQSEFVAFRQLAYWQLPKCENLGSRAQVWQTLYQPYHVDSEESDAFAHDHLASLIA